MIRQEERTGGSPYTTSYGYDLAGNITELNGSSFGSFDDANKFTSLSGGSIGYDADGNTTSLTRGAELNVSSAPTMLSFAIKLTPIPS